MQLYQLSIEKIFLSMYHKDVTGYVVVLETGDDVQPKDSFAAGRCSYVWRIFLVFLKFLSILYYHLFLLRLLRFLYYRN